MTWQSENGIATRNGSSGEIQDRQPPQALDSEAGALSAILTHPPAIADALSAGLSPQHFYDQAHRIVFAAMEEISIRGAIVDPTLLLPILRRAEEGLGTRAEALLVKLIGAPGLVANLPHYVGQVLDTARRRNFILTLNQLHIDAVGGRKTGDILETAAQQIECLRVGTDEAPPVSMDGMIDQHPRLAEPIIGGILRRGGTGNLVSATKIGKSWLAYMLALCVRLGHYWLDTFPCRAGRVLLIDNELFPAEVVYRIQESASAMGIQRHEYAGDLDVISLRGRLKNIFAVCKSLESIERGRYDLIIFDALYRGLPSGISENDNGAMAEIYNHIDRTTARLDCAWINVHHSSKGDQGDKRISDVGAGAGSQSRAVDAHVILREHEEQGVMVLESAVRSFKPNEPLAVRWNFPLWTPDSAVDTRAIKGRLSRQEQRTNERDEVGIAAIVDALNLLSAGRRRDFRGILWDVNR